MYCHIIYIYVRIQMWIRKVFVYNPQKVKTMYCVKCFFFQQTIWSKCFIDSQKDNFTTNRQLCQILQNHVRLYSTATQSGPNICRKRSFGKVWTKECYILHPSALWPRSGEADFEVKASRKSLEYKTLWGSIVPFWNIKPWTWYFKLLNRLQSIETVGSV